MKSYHGFAANEGRDLMVSVRTRKLSPLAHHVHHSPTGFEWGYSGSGPSDLARSLLMDAFGSGPCTDYPEECRCEPIHWAEAAYPAFRDAFIANFPQGEDWKLDQGVVVDWVFDYIDTAAEVEELSPQPA